MKNIIDRLYYEHTAEREELLKLISGISPENAEYLFSLARKTAQKSFGNKIYIRGLIEISSYCKNDCLYCGLRRSNEKAERYRLSAEQILSCCASGYELGFRTFVMQGGEDGYFTDSVLVDIISEIKLRYPDCAVTLSLGERSAESYAALKRAGADRYLLRHETAEEEHYKRLHPPQMSYKNRINCLRELKRAGLQTGTGFMVGSPYQTAENLVGDLLFIKEIKPEMIGIGPFIPHKDTPFAEKRAGEAELTVLLTGLLRLMNPNALIPSTTALATVSDKGRERGILAGANVVMPNLSPREVRGKYLLYNVKAFSGTEAAEGLSALKRDMQKIGYEVVCDRGDYRAEV